MPELADYAWLTAPETAPLLTALAEDPAELHIQLERLRKAHGPNRARLALALVELRKRAKEKFGPLSNSMFFTEVGLQQATDIWIARHKTNRFPDGRLVRDYCSGIGGDLIALAERRPVIGFDRSEIVCELARANLGVTQTSYSSEVKLADIQDHPPAADTLWHLDPDRRNDGQRSTQLHWHSPPPELIDDWLATSPHGAVKLAPATRVPQHWEAQAELEWISRDRECRQQLAWFGALAGEACRRRATVVTRNGESYSYVGEANTDVPLTQEVQEFVYDSDPALRAAGLTGSFSEQLGLLALASPTNYLTSVKAIEHPLLSCFRVLEQLPPREKPLAAALRARNIGGLEIKKRGVEIDPNQLLRRLKPRGDQEATVLLTRLGKKEVALLTERHS